VLLLSGELDPVTPPAYAERVIAGGLSNARHLVGPGQGHGIAAVGCVPRLIREFLAAPVPAELAADCLEAEQPTPFFLGLHGPGP
jgi:pimeloyl-ACP methyl ester carboxylesterase